ncbi:hypothetical protein MAFF301069_38110 (plasmid) [Ralstonia pseudosolanacearum]|nr:hypothetical protein MAFF301069_38110 [Ralstonia pseudosolanacearum]
MLARHTLPGNGLAGRPGATCRMMHVRTGWARIAGPTGPARSLPERTPALPPVPRQAPAMAVSPRCPLAPALAAQAPTGRGGSGQSLKRRHDTRAAARIGPDARGIEPGPCPVSPDTIAARP